MLAGYLPPSAPTGCIPQVEKKEHRTPTWGFCKNTTWNSKNDHSGQAHECEENYAQILAFYFCNVDFSLRSVGGSCRGAKRQRRDHRNCEGFRRGGSVQHADRTPAVGEKSSFG